MRIRRTIAMTGPGKWAAMLCWVAAVFHTGTAWGQRGADADVVVLSDTSASMSTNDPKNAVVLVTRLFADIVPGKLAAVRLFDLSKDAGKITTTPTNETMPCPDRPSEICHKVTLAPDTTDRVIAQKLLLSVRPGRGDTGFKGSLESLLAPTAVQTQYAMSWGTIEKLYQDNASPEEMPRVVVWLSDGDADDWDHAKPLLQKLVGEGVAVRALIFNTGKTEQVKQVGIQPYLVNGSPNELMKAFADAFRYIVQAPFREEGVVAQKPSFAIKPNMESVWVVTYGDESLSGASVTHEGKTVQADYASDHYRGSAYRVAYMENPPAGAWEVHVNGGGPEVSYAVIQRSTLALKVTPPSPIYTGIAFPLTATLRNGQNGQDLSASDLPEPVQVEAEFEGQKFPMNGDGKYTAMLTAHAPGSFTVKVRAHNSFFDRTVRLKLDAQGYFRYTGGPVTIDFGSFKAGRTVCQTLQINAEQQGAVPFELRPSGALPHDLRLELRGAGKRAGPGSSINLLPGDMKEVCLVAGRNAGNSQSDGQVWASFGVHGQDGSVVPVGMKWSVRELTFWEKWGKLILLGLLVLLVFFIIYGYIKPYRFPSGLSISFAPAMNELDDQTPQPVRMWKGVGIGFYRDARACLHDNFRINGKPKGAVAILQAGPRRAVFVKPASRGLYREVGFKEWEAVQPKGRRAAQGEIFRIGDSGPFFRLSMRA